MPTTRFLLGALAVATATAAAAPAHAQSIAAAADPVPAGPPAPRFWDARIGMLAGVADVGDTDGGSIGVTGAYGYHVGDVGLRAELAYYRVGDDPEATDPRRGRGERAALLARYSFASTAPTNTFIADLWGEAGAGYEHVAWKTGGVLDRPSGELAVGVNLGMRRDTGHGSIDRRKRVGYFMDVRSWIGEAPLVPGAMPGCGGPCTMATTPPRTDISMFFEFGVHWGR